MGHSLGIGEEIRRKHISPLCCNSPQDIFYNLVLINGMMDRFSNSGVAERFFVNIKDKGINTGACFFFDDNPLLDLQSLVYLWTPKIHNIDIAPFKGNLGNSLL